MVVDPEYTSLGGLRVKMRSQVQFDLVAARAQPYAVVLWEAGKDYVLTWVSNTDHGKGVVEIVHVGDFSDVLKSAHSASVNGFAAVFKEQGGWIIKRPSLEPTPVSQDWVRLYGAEKDNEPDAESDGEWKPRDD